MPTMIVHYPFRFLLPLSLLLVAITGCGRANLGNTPRDTMIRGMVPEQMLTAQAHTIAQQNSDVLNAGRCRDFPKTAQSKRELDKSWGICLSGGGIRSAYTAIGVLRALEQHGLPESSGSLLTEMDYFSGVSGGSWAMTWYLDQVQHQGDRKRLSDAMGFQQSLKHLRQQAQLTSTCWYAGQLFKWLCPPRWFGWPYDGKGHSYDAYADEIATTFLPCCKNRQLEDPSGPLFVYNANIRNGNSTFLSDRLFEATSRSFGSDALGHRNWSMVDAMDPPVESLKEWAAISGAAISCQLHRDIDITGRYQVGHHERVVHHLSLSDGGPIENLAALPLIKRGVRNVVIVDSEYDVGNRFEAYRKLKHMLRSEFDLEFSCPTIDRLVATSAATERMSYHRGAITGLCLLESEQVIPVTVQVHYIKMSLPAERIARVLHPVDPDGIESDVHRARNQSLYQLINRPYTSGAVTYVPVGKTTAKGRRDRMNDFIHRCTPPITDRDTLFGKEGQKPESIEQLIEWACQLGKRENRQAFPLGDTPWVTPSPKTATPHDPEEVLACVRVEKYATYLRNSSIWEMTGYDFPATTTSDQGFYTDQAEAQISLGYLMGLEAVSAMGLKPCVAAPGVKAEHSVSPLAPPLAPLEVP